MKVLIDGYNLRNIYGSGIKYYGIKIIEILTKNGYDISTLFDFNLSNNNKLVLSSEFYRKLSFHSDTKYSKIDIIKMLIKKNIIQEIDINNLEILKKDYYLKNCNIYNIPNLYMKSLVKKRLNIIENINLNQEIDIFHATYPLNITVQGAKKITTIHDLIPLKVPFVSLDNKKIFFNLIKKSIETSDKIVTISESSKRDILEFFDIDESKIINTYQTVYVPKLSSYYNDKKNLKKFKLKKDKYLLFVGNIEPKKNLGRVIEAFNKIDTDIKLVIVGKKAWMWEDELRFFDEKKMKLLSFLSRDDLLLLYKHAKAFIFPSLYEGFGLPPLEAMACGCPVVTSNISSLPEVCGNAAIYCEPYSINSISEAIEKALNLTPQERDELINKGFKRVEFFNDEDYFKRLDSVYKSIL